MQATASDRATVNRRDLGVALGAVTALALQAPASAASGEGTVPVSIPVGARKLSGRMRKADSGNARGLVFAIHGGGYTSKYFDVPGQSAIACLAAAGYDVLAIDRPGYGAAMDWLIGFDDQVSVLSDVVQWARGQFGTATGQTFLYGHSIGGMLALLMARKAPDQYLGLSMTGSGLKFHERFAEAMAARIVDPAAGSHSMSGEEARKAGFMAPPWSYDPKVAVLDPERDVPSMIVDLKEAALWEKRLANEAPQVKVPVQFIIGEYDGLWQSDGESLRVAAELFSSAPFSDVYKQRFAGHSVELHYVYVSQLARVIAFIEDCKVFRRKA